MLNTILKITDAVLKFNDNVIVKNINLHLRDKMLVAICAPNGSGKSSFFSALLRRPKYELDGKITMKDCNYYQSSTYEIARAGFMLLPQDTPSIEGVKYIDLFCEALIAQKRYSTYSRAKNECIKTCERMNIPVEILEMDVGKASHGQKRIMLCAAAALLKPSCVLFDETESGMDENFRAIFSEFIKSRTFCSILITHNKELVTELNVDNVYTITNGEWNEIQL